MKKWSSVLGVTVVVGVAILFTGQIDSLSAQLYCGINCMKCGPDLKSRQGMGAHEEGAYYIYCAPKETKFCDEEFCEQTVTMSASEVMPSEAAIVASLREMPLDQLSAFVSQHMSRLLVHEERGLLAVRGTGCRRSIVSTVVFLTPSRVAALAALGLEPLSGFLDG